MSWGQKSCLYSLMRSDLIYMTYMQRINKDSWESIQRYGTYASELDWIATDLVGQVGVFSAIGNVPIPDLVFSSYEKYVALMEKVDALVQGFEVEIMLDDEHGDVTDWLRYAKQGLFAFDFYDVHRTVDEKRNQYDLIARPKKVLKIVMLQLGEGLKEIIPQLDCNFQDGSVELEVIRKHVSE